MKALKTKVIMSAIVLVFALIATIGSTYAWFTTSTVVSVSGISLTVQSDESLLILVDDSYTGVDATSSDPGNYGITVTATDFSNSALYGTGGNEMSTWRLNTVTAGYGNTSGTNLTYTGLVDPTGANDVLVLNTMNLDTKAQTLTSNSNASTGDYIVVDFWLYSQSAVSEEIVLQDLVLTSNGANTASQDAVVDSLRLSTHVTGEDDLIFSTNPDYAFEFLSGDPGYDLSNAWENVLNATPTTGVQDVLVAAHSLFYGSGAVANVSAATAAGADVVATLAPNTPTKVSVTIYIEGWDEDASTDILNAGFSVEFKFALQNVG
jgi:hypothetical protein